MKDEELEKRADRFRLDAHDADEQWRILYSVIRPVIHNSVHQMIRSLYLPGTDDDEIHQIAVIESWLATDHYRTKTEYDSGYRAYIRATVRNEILNRLKYATCSKRDNTRNPSLDEDIGETARLKNIISDPVSDEIIRKRERQDARNNFWQQLQAKYPFTPIERKVWELRMAGLAPAEIYEKHGMNLRSQDNATQRIKNKARRFIRENNIDQNELFG